jgi:probable phosphoglycerate mutase
MRAMSDSDDAVPLRRSTAVLHPRTTTFLLVRHAESAANAGAYFGSQSDSPLSALGVVQARALAEALAGAAIDAVYSSDLSRARDTVAAIAAARGLAVHETPLLRERHMGELTGQSFDDVRSRYPEVWVRLAARDPHVVPPGGESQHDLAARVARFLDGLPARHRGQVVLIGSHGGTIHHLVRQLIGIHDLSVPFWLAVENASVTRVDLTEPAPGVLAPRLTYVNRVLPFGDEPLLP